MSALREEFIRFAVDCGVLRFGEFVTKAGRTSPYFFNAGLFNDGQSLGRLADYYADTLLQSGVAFDMLFGPAYKGIPLVAAVAVSLAAKGRNVPFAYNRKEAKDHGEGGMMVGYKPKDGDRIAIVEDVVTAGTAVRESIEFFKSVADVKIVALFVSVDRMERGTGEQTTLNELREQYGIQVYPIVTVRQVIEMLHNQEVDGKIIIDDAMKARMEDYLAEYGGK